MVKVLKCAGNDDSLVIRHEDNTNVVTFSFTSDKDDRTSEFDLKLMHLDADTLAIPVKPHEEVFLDFLSSIFWAVFFSGHGI